jgi:predicted oxidoreductase
VQGRSLAVDERVTDIIDITSAGIFSLGKRTVNRMGYGAMQLAGSGVFGPPKDRHAALALLRQAIARGVNHIDTSDYYGPHVTNQILREALHPYPDVVRKRSIPILFKPGTALLVHTAGRNQI